MWRACKHKFKEICGCKRSMVQSYVDEFVWRYNNNVNNNRKEAYNLIMKEIAKYYAPGQKYKLININVNYILNYTLI